MNVIIVDDESMFRERLRKEIKWEHYGFHVAGEAKNGEDALEQCKSRHIDLALVDIYMPFMNGLELSKHLKDMYPNMEIVIITAYGEFEYAKQAIKYGVSDYLLKPYDKEELVLTLLKIKARHDAMTKNRKIAENYKNSLREMHLNDLVIGGDQQDREAILEQLAEQGVHFQPEDWFQVISIELNPVKYNWDQMKERLLWKFAVKNIWDELSEEECRRVSFYGDEDRIVSIMVLEDGQKPDPDLYRRLCELIEKYLKLPITIGVGQSHRGLEQIEKSYQESLLALHNRFRLMNEGVVFYDQLAPNDSNVGSYSLFVNEEILIHLRMNEWEAIQDKLVKVQAYIIDNKLSLDYIFVIYMGFISMCLTYLEELGGSVEDVFGADFYPYLELKRQSSIGAIHSWITDIFKKVAAYNRVSKPTKSKKIALAAKDYIEAEYSKEDLNIEAIANHLYINAGYLRGVFKKEMGLQISKYLLNIRMQKAKEMLNQNTIKISEIALMAGYSDPGHFSKVFKKYFGYSPREYESLNKLS